MHIRDEDETDRTMMPANNQRAIQDSEYHLWLAGDIWLSCLSSICRIFDGCFCFLLSATYPSFYASVLAGSRMQSYFTALLQFIISY